jgi:hypothetical protein
MMAKRKAQSTAASSDPVAEILAILEANKTTMDSVLVARIRREIERGTTPTVD